MASGAGSPPAAASGEDPSSGGPSKKELEAEEAAKKKHEKEEEEEFEKEVHELQKEWKPSENDLKAAAEHAMKSSAGYREDKWLPLTMPARDMTLFGAGIQLQFGFNLGFMRVIWFCAVCAAPYVVFCLLGDNMQKASLVPSNKEGTPFEYIARTSPANMGRPGTVDGMEWERASPWIGGDIFSKDIGFVVSSVDALCVLIIFVVAIWYETRVIPFASGEHRLAESFAVYVDCLPRRLPDAEHYDYEELLHRHFGRVLRAHLHPEGKQVVAGLQVIKQDDQGQEGYEEPRCCGKRWCCRKWSPFDSKGRRIGKVVKGKEPNELKVQWRPNVGEKGGGQISDLKPGELFNHNLKKRIEFELAADNFVEEGKLVCEISLVRDYAGTLSSLKSKAIEKMQKRAGIEAAMEAHPEKKSELLQQLQAKDEKELAERTENYTKAKDEVDMLKKKRVPMSLNIPTEERDVLGAYVVFSRRRNRNFIFNEYRFSRTFLRSLQKPGLRFFGQKIRVREATDPSEVFWENMDVTASSQILRLVVVALVAIIMILVSVVIFSSAKQAAEVAKEYGGGAEDCNATQVFLDACLPDTDCECINANLFGVIGDTPAGVKACCDVPNAEGVSWLDQQLNAQYLTMGSSIAPAIMNFLISTIIHALAYFLKKQTLTETNVSIMVMTVIMLLINMVVCVIVVQCQFGPEWYDWVKGWLGKDNVRYFPVGTGTYRDLVPEWYIDVGAVVVFTLCISAVSIPAAMPASYIVHLVFKKACARRQKDSNSLKTLYTKPDYNVALISAQDAVMIVACISFSAGFPILWGVLAVYLTVSYWCKKYTFLRGSKEPPHFSYHLARMIAVYTQIAVLIHAFFGMRAFSEMDTLDSDVVKHFYDELGTNTTAATSIMSAGDDIWFLGDWIDRTDFVNTHPQVLVIVVVLLVGVIRLLLFIFGQAAGTLKLLLSRLLSDTEGSHSQGIFHQCLSKMGENAVGRCVVAFVGCVTAVFRKIANCIADFLPFGALDTTLKQHFDEGPMAYFREKKIPHSYDMKTFGPEYEILVTGRLTKGPLPAPAAAPANADQTAAQRVTAL